MNYLNRQIRRPAPGVKGCVIAIIVAVFIVGALIVLAYFAIQRRDAEFARQRQERRLRAVEAVRAGRTLVSVNDGELLALLADDAECVKTVKFIYFSMADLSDPRFGRLNEFPNLKEVGFYDCSNADAVLTVAKKMNSVESLFFEVTAISDSSLEAIAEFPNLEKVHFEQVVPDETIKRLNSLLPNVNVETPFPASKEPK